MAIKYNISAFDGIDDPALREEMIRLLDAFNALDGKMVGGQRLKIIEKDLLIVTNHVEQVGDPGDKNRENIERSKPSAYTYSTNPNDKKGITKNNNIWVSADDSFVHSRIQTYFHELMHVAFPGKAGTGRDHLHANWFYHREIDVIQALYEGGFKLSDGSALTVPKSDWEKFLDYHPANKQDFIEKYSAITGGVPHKPGTANPDPQPEPKGNFWDSIFPGREGRLWQEELNFGRLVGTSNDDVLIGTGGKIVPFDSLNDITGSVSSIVLQDTDETNNGFVHNYSAIPGGVLRLIISGGDGNDWVIAQGGQGVFTIGGMGRDVIFNTSIGGQ